jgi:hypothetical protein
MTANGTAPATLRQTLLDAATTATTTQIGGPPDADETRTLNAIVDAQLDAIDKVRGCFCGGVAADGRVRVRVVLHDHPMIDERAGR